MVDINEGLTNFLGHRIRLIFFQHGFRGRVRNRRKLGGTRCGLITHERLNALIPDINIIVAMNIWHVTKTDMLVSFNKELVDEEVSKVIEVY